MSNYTYAIQTNSKYNAESRLAQHIIANYGFNALDEMIMCLLDRAMREHGMFKNKVKDEDISKEHIAQVAKSMLKDYQ